RANKSPRTPRTQQHLIAGRVIVGKHAKLVRRVSPADVQQVIGGAPRVLLMVAMPPSVSTLVGQRSPSGPQIGSAPDVNLHVKEACFGVEPPVGIEPTTCSLRVSRSAD